VRRYLWTAGTNGPIVHPADDTWACRVMVEWYRQGKPKNSKSNLSQWHFVHLKFQVDGRGRDPGPPRAEAGD
jgi:hypothetical protein